MGTDIAIRLAEEFAKVAGEVLKQIAGKTCDGKLDDPTAENHEYAHFVEIQKRNRPKARLGLALPLTTFQAVGSALMGAPLAEDPSDPESVQAVEEFWRQVCGRANTEMADLLNGADLEIAGSKQRDWTPHQSVPLVIEQDGNSFRFCLVMNQEAVEALQLPVNLAEQSPSTCSSPPNSDGKSTCDYDNLALLMDIPLTVTLRFGGQRLALSEIVKLTSGAVIELDRQAEEPVDLCLENRVIARGQVVVVDGCYGLQVTQVCRPVNDLVGVGGAA